MRSGLEALTEQQNRLVAMVYHAVIDKFPVSCRNCGAKKPRTPYFPTGSPCPCQGE